MSVNLEFNTLRVLKSCPPETKSNYITDNNCCTWVGERFLYPRYFLSLYVTEIRCCKHMSLLWIKLEWTSTHTRQVHAISLD